MKIQGVRLQGTKLVPSGAAVVESDTYFNLVSLLLPGNGTNGAQNNTFLDSSSNALTVTRSGNPTQGTFSPFSQTGWSNYFDGTGDYLSVADSAVLDNNTTYTFECWFFQNAAGDGAIYSRGGGAASWSTTNGAQWQVFIQSGAFYVQWNTSGSPTSISTTAPAAGVWHNITVGYNGTTTRVWLDGSSIGTSTNGYTLPTTRNVTRIGFDQGSQIYLNGYVSNLRLVKGTDVYGVANTTITPPTSSLTAIANTSLLTCQSNRFIDNSTNALAITANGNTAVQAFSPFDPTAAYSTTTVGGSAYLDGSGDYLTISNPASLLTFGTGDFTIECFVYPTAASSSSYVCWIYGTTTVINAIIINSNTGAVTFRLRGTNLSETNVTSSSGLLRVGEWTHLALVRTGTNFYGYVNGTRFSTTIASNAAFNEAQAQFFTQPQIGAKSNTVGDYFTGYVSGWRALKGTALYTAATITVPSAPLTDIANTSALLNSTNGGITDAAAKNVLETVGDAKISTAQSKWGGSAMLFDGTGDYLQTRTSPNLDMSTGDMTIEGWFYLTTAPADYQMIVSDAFNGNNYVTIRGGGTGGQIEVNVNGTSFRFNLNNSVSANTWFHLAVTRSTNTWYGFINGTSLGNTTNSGSFNLGNVGMFVGRFGGGTAYAWPGYMDDLRITKGLARYTANFTPPTQAFPTQ